MTHTWTVTYNQALERISSERYEEAKQLLYGLLPKNVRDPQFYWTLGLIEFSTGFLYEGLMWWKKIPEGLMPNLEACLETLRELLPEYDRMHALYNRALTHAQNGRFDEAIDAFQQLFSVFGDLRLSGDMYFAAALSFVLKGDLSRAESLLQTLPDYCKNDLSLRLLSRQISLQTVSVSTGQAAQPQTGAARTGSNKRAFILAGTVGLVACVIALAFWLKPAPSVVPTAVLNESAPIVTNKAAEQQSVDKMHKLESDNARLAEQLQASERQEKEAALKVETLQTNNASLEKTIQLTIGDISKAKEAAALKAYQSGLKWFKQGKFKDAYDAFQISYAQQTEAYFSDDSQYFSIESLLRLNELDEASKLREQFIANTSVHFKNSPYLDDLILEQAQAYIKQGLWKEANPLLERLIQEFPSEWEAKQALLILQKLPQG